MHNLSFEYNLCAHSSLSGRAYCLKISESLKLGCYYAKFWKFQSSLKKDTCSHNIHHIFWELQFAELPECIAVSKLPGLDPVSGSAMAAPFKSVVRAIPSSDGNSRTPPEIHEGPPNLAESNGFNHFHFDLGREHSLIVGEMSVVLRVSVVISFRITPLTRCSLNCNIKNIYCKYAENNGMLVKSN
jgi:hypothetical protein